MLILPQVTLYHSQFSLFEMVVSRYNDQSYVVDIETQRRTVEVTI